MHILLKGTLVSVSLLTALWAGQHFLVGSGPIDDPQRLVITAEPPQPEPTIPAVPLQHEAPDAQQAPLDDASPDSPPLSTPPVLPVDPPSGAVQALRPAIAEIHPAQHEETDEDTDTEAGEGDEERGRQQAEVIDPYEEAFWQEPIDAAWSIETEAQLTLAWESAALEGSQLLLAACQSTMCQVEISHNSPEARDQFLTNLPLLLPFPTGGYLHDLPAVDGVSGTVVYFARTGHGLPPRDGMQSSSQP